MENNTVTSVRKSWEIMTLIWEELFFLFYLEFVFTPYNMLVFCCFLVLPFSLGVVWCSLLVNIFLNAL